MIGLEDEREVNVLFAPGRVQLLMGKKQHREDQKRALRADSKVEFDDWTCCATDGRAFFKRLLIGILGDGRLAEPQSLTWTRVSSVEAEEVKRQLRPHKKAGWPFSGGPGTLAG